MPDSFIRGRMPELDFWRGVAIASVVLYHGIYWSQSSQPNRVADWITRATVFGWLGVNLFFVLSGFLITGILLDSKGKPTYFRSFYARRIRRIVPAYILCLCLLLSLHMISPGALLKAVTFTANYNLVPGGTFAPLWSLSVEEQFYMVWPLVVLLASRRILAGICIGVCISEPVLRYFGHAWGGSSYDGLIIHGTLFVADSLALGALGALFFRSRWADKKSAIFLATILAVVASAVFLIGYPYGLLHRTNSVGAALQVVPFNLTFAAAVIASVALKPHLLASNMTRPLRWLGDISYGLYLYHLIVFSVYSHLLPASSYGGRFGELLVRALVCTAVSITMAWISRWKIEEIFLQKRALPLEKHTSMRGTVRTLRPSRRKEGDAPQQLVPNASGEDL